MELCKLSLFISNISHDVIMFHRQHQTRAQLVFLTHAHTGRLPTMIPDTTWQLIIHVFTFSFERYRFMVWIFVWKCSESWGMGAEGFRRAPMMHEKTDHACQN
jgi:hypothetical protein